jgi:hypothetical protein
MFLGVITLLTALAISGVAVYYSVSGLAAIFAGAAVPIIIMGASLEVGKLVTASWLHKNWKTAPFILKTYLSIATIILMLITSMGIFGFLSRAHVEQGAPIGEVQAQIELIDEKISAKRQEIEQAKTALKNLDSVVEQFMAKGKDERSVAAANNARKGQQAERNKTTKSIEDAQKEISKLQEQKMPLTQQVRKIETEVGPIKYIAAFIYGDNPDQNLLERAVTWMILTIIFVFDPLAVLLLIAGQISIIQNSKKKEHDPLPPIVDEIKPIVEEPVIVRADETLKEPEPVADQKEEIANLRLQIEEMHAAMKQQQAQDAREIFEKIEKGEITFENQPVEDYNNADVIITEDNASSSVTVDAAEKTEWPELEQDVEELKKKEQKYMMRQGKEQITLNKNQN